MARKNYFAKLGVYLPWDALAPGQGFFLPGADEGDFSTLRATASRKKISISVKVSVEAQGSGVRVTRNG